MSKLCRKVDFERTPSGAKARDRDGRLVGSLSVDLRTKGMDTEAVVGMVRVDDAYQRCGIATKLYEMALDVAEQNEALLQSDTSRTAESEAFWQKQVRKGRAKCKRVGRGAKKLAFDSQGNLVEKRGRWHCNTFTMIGKPSDLSGIDLKSPRTWIWAGGAALVLGALTHQAVVRFGGPGRYDSRTGTYVNQDPALLLPSFRSKIGTLFSRLRAEGYNPKFWEGYRTPERAQKLEDLGLGIARSMHIYGAGADIVDADKFWHNPAFFRALGRHAEALGLTWGGRFNDPPHIQAVPVAMQNRLRAAGSRAQRDTLARTAMAA